MPVQIMPAMIKCFFFINLLGFFLKENHQNFRWLEVSNYLKHSVVYSGISRPSNPNVEAMFFVISDSLERLLHPVGGIPTNAFCIIVLVAVKQDKKHFVDGWLNLRRWSE